MNKEFLEKLQQTFSDLTTLSPDKIRGLMDDTLKVFQELQEKMQSQDPRDREEALQASLEIKEALEGQIEQMGKQFGIDPEQLMKLAENAQNLPQEEAGLVSEIQQKFQGFREERTTEPEETPRKKAEKIKIMG